MASPAVEVQPMPSATEALNQINEIVTRYCESQMFFTACNLGIFEQLAGGPASAAELGEWLRLHPEPCRRLLLGLTGMGLLQRDGDRFANSPVAAYLTLHAPVPMEPLCMWGSLFQRSWSCLDDAVREFGPRWQQAFGATADEAFANLYKDPAALRRFCGLMSAYSIPQGQVLADAFDFAPYSRVMDVAGGAGGMIIEIGRKHAHMRGIVMDLPPVCEIADEHIAAAGLSGRFVSRSADLFAGPYPAGADVITLGWVLHDWNDDNCRRILRNCYDALPSGGALLIVESVLHDDHSGTPFGVLMSLHMLVLCEPGARERTQAEYRTLLEETGFRMETLVRLPAPRDLLIARKP
ncbi:putative O-demethylpuromycin-O-methyltransferase [Candidatus Sulfopaludibacter sp. SbA3]|nr:putative O-demethylpuromycin-O-methyltransferase [Candidatus Sulfopaludibacter sp. SbA3]